MDNKEIRKHLNKSIEKQIPDVWSQIETKIHTNDTQLSVTEVYPVHLHKRKTLVKRLSIAAAICLLSVSTLTYTPVLGAIQEMYDKLFSSQHIDDTGLKVALDNGIGQSINLTFYDKENDITVHFQNVLTDDKETKLLLTYQSNKTNLENYYVDIFEGVSSIHIVSPDGKKVQLNHVGWGSRYYDSKENKVAEALSFDSIKAFAGKEIRLEVENITIYNGQKTTKVETIWPLSFSLNQSAISDRETIALNTEFTFENESYIIKQVEFSELETRVVVTGTDTKLLTDENGMEYRMMSKLEQQFLNSRTFNKGFGYTVKEGKSGVFLNSAGDRVNPIFNKGEVEGEQDEYIMSFAPVKDRENTILEIGEDIKIPLIK